MGVGVGGGGGGMGHLGGKTAAEKPAKFQSHMSILITDLTTSILCEILQLDALCDIESVPRISLNFGVVSFHQSDNHARG